MSRILITGSRNWTNASAIKFALELAVMRVARVSTTGEIVVVHGAARGADSLAAMVAAEMGLKTEAHPANWRHGRSAGPRRNAAMVALGADLCLAFPLGASPGTRGCVRLARAAGIPVENWGAP